MNHKNRDGIIFGADNLVPLRDLEAGRRATQGRAFGIQLEAVGRLCPHLVIMSSLSIVGVRKLSLNILPKR
jgi:hypothetical protein